MATCEKCGNTIFTKETVRFDEPVVIISCSKCGKVIGTFPKPNDTLESEVRSIGERLDILVDRLSGR